MFSPHTVSVYRPEYTIERAGNPLADLPATALKTLNGFFQPTSAKEQVTFLQQNIEVTNTFYTFDDPDLQVDDVVKFNGKYYWVTGVVNACELNECWSVYLNKWQGVQKIIN